MSIHASWVYANFSDCNNFTGATISPCQGQNINNTNDKRIKQEKYTTAAEVGSVIGGLIIGIVLGFAALLINQLLLRKTKSLKTNVVAPTTMKGLIDKTEVSND